MKYTFLLSLVLGILAMSCDKSLMNRKVDVTEEINLRGLFDTLHLAMHDRNPLLIKNASVENLSDTSEMKLDSAGWAKELENFRDMNIRPGRLQGRYKKSESTSDQLQQTIYRSKSPKQEDLDSLFVLQDENGQIRQLRFYINYKNYLNTTQKMMQMDFDPLLKNNFPSGYLISGWQKLRTKDTVSFDIRARIEY